MLSVTLERDPEESFAILKNGVDANAVAEALEIPLGQLLHILYKRIDAQYRVFSISKRRGGKRVIMAPKKSLNILQHKLLAILQEFYDPPEWVHGFVNDRSIVSNAERHKRRQLVINLDLQDFFDHVNFGRVRGTLKSPPWRFHDKVATVIAQLVTFENRLPQGACTSPLFSNLVAWALDRKLIALAKRHKLTYTRYADDITLSTSHRVVDAEVLSWEGANPVLGRLTVGKDLRKAIHDGGFTINEAKLRVQIPSIRQEVTGLTVNEFPNVQRSFVRKIRALIHSWRSRGLVAAEKHHIENYAKKPPPIPEGERNGVYFKQVVYGCMAHLKNVRGPDDKIYLKFCGDLALLDENPPFFIQMGKDAFEVFDFFICHASEDKDAVARPLYENLQEAGARTFLDEKYITLGDSFVQKINHALGRSKFVIAIISERSFRKAWPVNEISTALAMESSGEKKLIPVMVGGESDISTFLGALPLLAHRIHHKWDGDAADAAKEIMKVLGE